MKFYQKIMITAIFLAACAAGAAAIELNKSSAVEMGWWVAIGEELIGTGESGWCSCL